MPLFHEIKESFLQLFFPHICVGCGSDLLSRENMICIRCMDALPQTQFELHADNPTEKIFWGRLPLESASSQYYFSKDSLMQRLMHQIKYKNNKELCIFLGRLMGQQLIQSNRFSEIDALIPLPLHPEKEKRRGYNQANLLCIGMAETMYLPVISDAVIRTAFTESQTNKGRVDRWLNMENKFEIANEELLQNKQLLLIDDVVTTGATLEACGMSILSAGNTRLSIATLCYAS
jgi:ComF family protein